MEKWFLKKRNFWPEELSGSFGIENLIAEILSRRELESHEAIQKYLSKSRDLEHNPFLLKDMEKAINLLLEKTQSKEKVLLSLDYDVDGIISGAISYLGLTKLGLFCECIFPHRVHDGYGLNKRIVQYAIDNNFSTIVTFDNGISSFEAVDFANENGIQVIVTDHHEVPQILSKDVLQDYLVNADAIINPKQQNCNYPYDQICGAMIAYKLVNALNMSLGYDESNLSEIYPLVAIATICDVMNLQDENRVYVEKGLKLLSKTNIVGLKYLLEALNIQDNISVEDVGFKIGPCLNASGRLSSAQKAYRLFVEQDEETAKTIASELILLNQERKTLTFEATQKAINKVEEDSLYKNNILVLLLEDIHESLAGIVAGRLKEHYDLPALIFCESDGIYKGSARSTDDVNIFEALNLFKSYLLKFGGHSAAAGMSIEPKNFPEFSAKLIQYMNQIPLKKEKHYFVDAIVSFEQLKLSTAKQLSIFEPTGKGNPSILLSCTKVKISRLYYVGKKNNVLKVDFFADGSIKSFVSFSCEKILEKIKNKLNLSPESDIINTLPKELFEISFDILFQIGINNYNGNEYLNLELISIR